MPKTDTKQRILTESLALFSKSGYDGVSMRDIARAVGFRESALYKHFASKQEILDCIFTEMKGRYESAARQSNLPDGEDFSAHAAAYKAGGTDGLKKQCAAIFLYWLKDEQAAQFRRLIMLEQFRHSQAEQLLRTFFMDGPLQYQAALFADMMRIGYFKKADPDVLALQFYSPLFFLLCKYDAQPEQEQEALSLLERFVTEFDATHRSGEA